MKKMATLILVALLPMLSFADEAKINGLWYNLVSQTKQAKVIPWKGILYSSDMYSGNIKIPATVKYGGATYSVTSIGKEAFYGCNGLTSVTIPNSVTSIDEWAFNGCSGLTSVHISDLEAWCKIAFNFSVSNPLYYAHHLFMNGVEITDLVIPNSVTSISYMAFAYCTGLTSVTMGNSVTSIGNYAFEYCRGLTSVTMGNSVTSIGNYAFQYCRGLTSVTMGNSVTSIGESAFRDCASLTSITIPNSVNSIGNYAFYNCKGLTSVNIGNGVTSIGDCVFQDCSNLTSIIIPKSVTSIGDYAFCGCSGLTDVWCYAESVPSTHSYSYAFLSSSISSATLHVPAGSVEAYRTTEPWSGFGNIVAINANATYYTLTYFVDGEVYKTYKVEEGSVITPEPAPTKEGYTFSGWTYIPPTMPAADVVVMGSYIQNYTLTYIVDGKVYKTYSVAFDSAITPEPEPIKDGYTFSGWSEIPETMPAHDVTVTGTFTKDILGKCATPTISYANGEVTFNSETEGVTFIFDTNIEDKDIKGGIGNKLQFSVTYHISVYATKADYENSDTIHATLCWIDAEPKTEGIQEDAVTEVKAVPILIQTQGGNITIQGAAEGTPIAIYGVDGKMYGSADAEKERTTIATSLRPGSVAVVKIGEKAVKVLLK